MFERRILWAIALGASMASGAARGQQAPPAAVRMNQLGSENLALAQQAGTWNVTETVWDSPGAEPVTTTGLVAERRMVGSTLQEVIAPASGGPGPAFQRIDYLSFNRVEGRWEYVSMDSRAPVGIMPAWSFAGADEGRIVLTFQPFAVAGAGSDVTGQMLRMQQVVTHQGPNADIKEQYFIMADGTGTMWLAHRYAYARR